MRVVGEGEWGVVRRYNEGSGGGGVRVVGEGE